MAILKNTQVDDNLEVTGNLIVDGKLELQEGNLNTPTTNLVSNNKVECAILQTQRLMSLSGYKVPTVLSSGFFHPPAVAVTVSTGGIYLPSTAFTVPEQMDLYAHVSINNRPQRDANSYIYYDILINGSRIARGNAGNSSDNSHIRSHNVSGITRNRTPGSYTIIGQLFIAGGTTRLDMSSGEGFGVFYYILGIPV